MARRSGRLAVGMAILALALPGCDGTGGTDAGPDAAVTLTSMGFGAKDEIATARLNEARKAIAPSTIQLGEGAFDAQRFLSAVAAGSPPDLVYLDRRLLGTYVAKGTLEPLTNCVAKRQINLATYRRPAVEEATVAGTLYGMPEFYNGRTVMINNAALKSAGIDPAAVSSGDWTALRTLTQQLTRVNGGKPARIGLDPRLPELLPMWAQANGVSMLSRDGRTANLTDPKVVEALDYTTALIKAQGGWDALKSVRDTWTVPGARNQFAADQLAIVPAEDAFLNTLADSAPGIEITVVPLTGPGGRQVDWITGNAWAITAGSRHKDQACGFIKAMTDYYTWVKGARARADARRAAGKPYTGMYTGNIRADNIIFGELVQPSGNASLDAAVKAVLAAHESAGYSMPSSPAGAEFQKAWTDAVNRVLTGQQTAADALAQAQREAQQALDAATRK